MLGTGLVPGSEPCLHTRVLFQVGIFHLAASDLESVNKFIPSLTLQASASADNISTDRYHSYNSIIL